jgi:hypothetical protein
MRVSVDWKRAHEDTVVAHGIAYRVGALGVLVGRCIQVASADSSLSVGLRDWAGGEFSSGIGSLVLSPVDRHK